MYIYIYIYRIGVSACKTFETQQSEQTPVHAFSVKEGNYLFTAAEMYGSSGTR